MESFQILGISSLGVWLGDGEGKVRWGVNELSSRDEKFGSPNVVTPLIGKDSFVGVDELIEST